MLNIWFGEKKGTISDPSVYFDNVYDDKWIKDPVGRMIISEIDHSEVMKDGTIYSPAFNRSIKPIELSGGAKTLLLMAYGKKDQVFNATACGDNCAPWILKLADTRAAQKKPLVINLHYLMDFGEGEFRIRVRNTNHIVKNMRELVLEAGEYV